MKAIRAGEKVEILAFDIMVGDILLLEKGDLIPADGIVLESFALLVDESSMTGESDMIEKSTVYSLSSFLSSFLLLSSSSPFSFSLALYLLFFFPSILFSLPVDLFLRTLAMVSHGFLIKKSVYHVYP